LIRINEKSLRDHFLEGSFFVRSFGNAEPLFHGLFDGVENIF